MVLLVYSCIFLLAVGYLVVVGFSFGSGKPIRHILANSLLGFLGLLVVNILSYFTKIKIPINIFTVLGSALYGVPADIFFLIINLVFRS